MCITSAFQKYRTQKCNNSNDTNITRIAFNTNNNNTFVLFNVNVTINNFFCSDNEDIYPWYVPELDIYNQHHMTFYNDNDTEVGVFFLLNYLIFPATII